MFSNPMSFAKAVLFALILFFAMFTPAKAAVVGSDGGITLWVSWDNLDAADAELSDAITEANSLPGGFGCTVTNSGRSAVSAPDSPPSCPATGTCTGADKLSGDIEFLADYIFNASEGAHYLRRVYVSDKGRAWDSVDIKWNIGNGGSSAPGGGWADPSRQMRMQSAYRTCIHDIAHHELGHYFYGLPDRYANSSGYYSGSIDGGTVFDVDVTERDINTVMSSNFPHLFVDTTNARLVVDYDQPGPGSTTGEVLTPDLLDDADPNNDGPDRAHHGHTHPFAQDEWSLLPTKQIDLAGVHTEGSFANPGARPDVDIVFIGDDDPHPGSVLLLDRSGSMGVTTNGVPASQFVQEAGMYLYHSSQPGDFVGTYLYNADVEELFSYQEYDASNDLSFVNFRDASGLTNIAEALKTAIDALIAEHSETGANGGEIFLMSDGRQTTGDDLWDEVTRANMIGIKIHTLLFGNADAATMESIATATSGSATQLSEKNDAAELKAIMNRKLSTGRGRTPVFSYKGNLNPSDQTVTLSDKPVRPHTGQFSVPPKSRMLQFYLYLTGELNPDNYAIQLVSPSGLSFSATDANNVAEKGRFDGLTVNQPESGIWSYLIIPVNERITWPIENIEIAAYVDNRELTGRFWMGKLTENGDLPLYAQLHFRYPLTDIDVQARLFAAGREVGLIEMFDNGLQGADQSPRDGVYSALLDRRYLGSLLKNGSDDANTIRVEVEYTVNDGSGPAPRAHYETGFSPELAIADYQQLGVSGLKAWATGVIKTTDFEDRSSDRPNIDNGTLDLNPGTNGWRDFGFNIYKVRPLLSQLRVSFGPDFEVEVDDISSCTDNDNSNVLCASVSGRVRPRSGDTSLVPQDVKVQFGDIVLDRPNFTSPINPGVTTSPGTDGFTLKWIKICWAIVLLLLILLLLALIKILKLKSR